MECLMWIRKGHSSRDVLGVGDGCLNCGSKAQEVSEERNVSMCLETVFLIFVEECSCSLPLSEESV